MSEEERIKHRRLQDRKRYANDPNRRAMSRVYTQRKYQRFRTFLLDWKERHPCCDCGETDPIVLEFDHVGSKTANISEMFGKAWKTLKEEIATCDVVCANCHRRRTARRIENGDFKEAQREGWKQRKRPLRGRPRELPPF